MRVTIRGQKGIEVSNKIILGFLAMAVLSCSSAVMKDSFKKESTINLTERELWRMHNTVPLVSFVYESDSVSEGLLLRWKPDSILIQPRETDLPIKIPASGMIGIRVATGNRILESLAFGTVAAGAYIGLAKSYSLGEASITEAIAKLLGPPLIIFGTIAIGSSLEKYEYYRIPDGFEFDYEKANSLYELLE
jgi:hypothetical protein